MKQARQKVFSIVAAIFLVVVIALIAAFMVNIGNVQRTTSSFAVIGTRGHFAAVSGIDWAVHQVLSNPGAPACFASPTTFTLPGGGNAFRVTANCTPSAVTEGTDNYAVFDISVIAEFGVSGQEDYFSRTLAASVSTLP